MKTNFIYSLLLCIILSSCNNDSYAQEYNDKQIKLTSQNYLYEGDLKKSFLTKEMKSLNASKKSDIKLQLSLIIDLSIVGKNFPIPCDLPNGRCVPDRLGYLLLSLNTASIKIIVSSFDGKKKGEYSKLSPLPDYESKLQYIKIPFDEFGKQIKLNITSIDIKGLKTSYEVTIGDKY